MLNGKIVDPQPLRNSRPEPSFSEILARTPTPRALGWLWAWWPAIVWSGVIFAMSTDTFSAEHTKWFFEPILRWLVPGLAQNQYDLIHHLIRKCAHFTEYFVFCLLLYRAARVGAGPGGPPRYSSPRDTPLPTNFISHLWLAVVRRVMIRCSTLRARWWGCSCFGCGFAGVRLRPVFFRVVSSELQA